MPSKNAATPTLSPNSSPKPRREAQSLDSRYGEIGISAVAAAVRYQGDTKKPADAPAGDRDSTRLIRFSHMAA